VNDDAAASQSRLGRFIAAFADVVGGESASDGGSVKSDDGLQRFEDWSEYTIVDGVEIYTPQTADDVVRYCNQAVTDKYRVRALGHRHNWSPLVLKPGTPANPHVRLVDTRNLKGASQRVASDSQMQVTFGVGTTLEDATKYLEKLAGSGASPATGYSFLNMPAPGALTLGGILAIGGHGTSVPWNGMQEPDLMGCLSNLIVSFKAITSTSPGAPYAIQEFNRSDADASAFLVHLGRSFITEVTLAPVPNYYLQLTNVFAPMQELMASPSSPPTSGQTFSSLLDAHGRVELIWFPYQGNGWAQCNTRYATMPSNGTPTTGPYNFPWMNGIFKGESDWLKSILVEHPALIPVILEFEYLDAHTEMIDAVFNGTARNLEIYLTDDTLRMTMFGYALQLPRREVQQAVSDFYSQVNYLLSHNSESPHPINGAVEIRCTTIDRQADLGVTGAKPPALAVTHAIDNSVDTVLWVDVVTFPNTKGSNELFVDLENWMMKTWPAAKPPGRLRPEWSKGFAYTADGGPWTNDPLIEHWIPSVYDRASDGLTFDWAAKTLAKYDSANIFWNDFLELLFP
jgi:hypothetical protein